MAQGIKVGWVVPADQIVALQMICANLTLERTRKLVTRLGDIGTSRFRLNNRCQLKQKKEGRVISEQSEG